MLHVHVHVHHRLNEKLKNFPKVMMICQVEYLILQCIHVSGSPQGEFRYGLNHSTSVNTLHTQYLCACHSDLWSSVDVHSAVGLPGNGTPNSVGDAHHKGSPSLAVPQGIQSISGLPCKPWRERRGEEEGGGKRRPVMQVT